MEYSLENIPSLFLGDTLFLTLVSNSFCKQMEVGYPDWQVSDIFPWKEVVQAKYGDTYMFIIGCKYICF